MLKIDGDDAALMEHLQVATGGTMSDVLRWALRWYAAGGPHRHPDDQLPDKIRDILQRRSVGPALMEGVK